MIINDHQLAEHEIATAQWHYQHGGPIFAIKYLREITFCGLKEAKDAIDCSDEVIPAEMRAEQLRKLREGLMRKTQPGAVPEWTADQERAVTIAWIRGLGQHVSCTPTKRDWYDGLANDLERGHPALDVLRSKAGKR